MTCIDLATIRTTNEKRLDGYWKRTIAALCDEVEQLRKNNERPPSSGSTNLLAIRRIADSGDPVPPWVLRALCNRHERLLDASCAWDNAIDRCDGIAAAEEQLRAMLKERR